MKAVHTCLLILCLTLVIYGFYCGFHMSAFIGTGHYWSNVWFYKAHACLFALIILRLALGMMIKNDPR